MCVCVCVSVCLGVSRCVSVCLDVWMSGRGLVMTGAELEAVVESVDEDGSNSIDLVPLPLSPLSPKYSIPSQS
eukprot:1853205-Rhodomonas_salina.1